MFFVITSARNVNLEGYLGSIFHAEYDPTSAEYPVYNLLVKHIEQELFNVFTILHDIHPLGNISASSLAGVCVQSSEYVSNCSSKSGGVCNRQTLEDFILQPFSEEGVTRGKIRSACKPVLTHPFSVGNTFSVVRG